MTALWSEPLFRLGVALIAIGLIGLTVHFWAPFLALIALPGRKELA